MAGAIMTAFGLIALAVAGFGFLARFLPITNHVLLGAAALSPYLVLAAPVSLLLLLPARRWALSVLAGGLTIAVIAVQLPLFTGGSQRTEGVRLRVMSANLFLGEADAKALVATADANADLLAVQELTPYEVKKLAAAGVDKIFPYRVLAPLEVASGTGLWSRFPITASDISHSFNHALVTARIQVAGVAEDPVVIVAHLPGPWPQPLDTWMHELAAWPQLLRDAATTAGPGAVIAAGDFNSTLDMAPFRRLLRDGYHDAAEQSGAGITATFPANLRIPPLIAIDHVLTRQCTATDVRTVEVAGSDHRGLITTIDIPRGNADRQPGSS